MTLPLEGVTVLVLDTEAKSGPTVVRALGRAGAKVIAAATSAKPSPAQRSRYAAATPSQPHALADADGLVDWLDSTIDEHEPDCVVPQTEYTIRVLDASRERFEGRTALAAPPHDSLELCFDKDRLLSLAEELGVAIPKTWRPASPEQAMDLAHELDYPVYVKARESYDFRMKNPRFARGRFVHDAEAFRGAYAKLDAISPDPLIQEAVPGHLFKVDGVYRNGECVSLYCQKVTRTWPISGGYGVFRESIPVELAPTRQAKALMAALEWTGPAEVEFIGSGEADGFRLMEVNGRFWGSLEFAHLCGIPIAVNTVKVAMGLDSDPDPPYPAGKRMRWLEGDLKRLEAVFMRRRSVSAEALQLPGRQETLWKLVRDFRPSVHQDDLYLDDLRPWLSIQARMIRMFASLADPAAPRKPRP